MQSSYDKAASAKPTAPLNGASTAHITPALTPSIASNIKGKDLFDSILWKDPLSTSVFYSFIASLRKKIREEVKVTTPTHRFIRTLRDSQKLVRCYTQNIDGLEAREGLCTELERGKGSRSRFTKKTLALPKAPARKLPGGDQYGGCEVVQLHGDLDTLRCTLCQKICGWEEGGREALLLSGKAPECLSCTLQDQGRRDRGKRGTKIGTLRPNIVLYGEEHPAANAVSLITTNDLSFAPDVLLILGTSLHVHGLKVLVKEFAKAVHARAGGKGKVIFVNLTKPSESVWKDVIDYWVSMDCDQWVGGMRRHRPDLWQIQTELGARVAKAGVRSQGTLTAKDDGTKRFEEKENGVLGFAHLKNSTLKPTSMSPKRKIPLRDSETVTRSEIILGSISTTALSPNDLKRKRSDMQQLPTPPSSGRRRRFQDLTKHDSCHNQRAPTTPSKRRKTDIVIFED